MKIIKNYLQNLQKCVHKMFEKLKNYFKIIFKFGLMRYNHSSVGRHY